MPPSKLDSIYRRLLITRFFEKGWGTPENLQRFYLVTILTATSSEAFRKINREQERVLQLFEFRKIISRRESCYKLIPQDYPIEIVKNEKYSDCSILEGKFMTPFELHLPGVVPKAAQEAHFQVILPKKWNDERFKPICIHLAGTGDHFFWRRRNFIAKPLLKEANIGAIILENPFYGLRKPDHQVRSNLQNVSDIFVMGGCLILECLVLLHWCERNGLGPLGITGLSMGGHMASLAAANWPKPLVLVPCLSWSTAAPVFTTGVMSQSINWDMLETQYHSDGEYSERLSKMVTVVDDAFSAGQKFIKNFNQSLEALKNDISDTRHVQKQVSVKIDNKYIEINNHKNKIESSRSIVLNSNLTKDVISNKGSFQITNSEKSNKAVTTEIQEQKKQSALTKLMKFILPIATQNNNKRIDITKTNWWEREALQFMRGMMDECTHLKNFSVPFDTSLIIAVCAKDDAYVPREGCSSLEEIWPGVEVRYLDAGHVSAYVLHQKLFRCCIIEAFERSKKVYIMDQGNIGEDLKTTLTYKELVNKYTNSI